MVNASGEPFDTVHTPSFQRIVLGGRNCNVVRDVTADAVALALQGVDLFFQKENRDFLDGVSYEIHFETMELEGLLRFGNPQQPHLVRLSEALFLTAKDVVAAEGNDEFVELMAEWALAVTGFAK